MSSHREVYEELFKLFDFNPPEQSLKNDFEAHFTCPNMFYDRHLDLQLTLKHVRLVPSLAPEISKIVYDELKLLKDKGQLLPLIKNDCKEGSSFITQHGSRNPSNELLLDATGVAGFFSETSLHYFGSIASTIALYPHCESWLPVLYPSIGWHLGPDQSPSMADNFVHLVIRDPCSSKLMIPDAVSSCLSEELLDDLGEVADRFKSLVALQFHVPNSKVVDLFVKMGETAKRKTLPWPKCSIVDCEPSYALPPVPPITSDSVSTINSLPSIAVLCAPVSESRRSARLGGLASTSGKAVKGRTGRKGRESVITQPEVRRLNRSTFTSGKAMEGQTGRKGADIWPTVAVKSHTVTGPDASLFIQRAWTRSSYLDSTLIVFNCGRFERIGFRHRESQTLFLSDLINVSRCSNPAYGQLHIGLYMLMLRDALDRVRGVKTTTMEGSRTDDLPASNKQKGAAGDSQRTSNRRKASTKRKRYDDLQDVFPKPKRSRNEEREHESELALHEINCRTLALLRLQYGPFNSPSPAALRRIGPAVIPSIVEAKNNPRNQNMKTKRKYGPNDYFRITLTSEIAQGAASRVHGATIEFQTADGQVHSCEVAVKIAFDPDKQQKMRHEYAVYLYMGLKNVKSIATVYGLFEDVANEALILVMSNAGESLDNQQSYGRCRQVSLTEKEKTAFMVAMTEIHEAGIRHYDIRPQNMAMDDGGKATIIDFDLAKVKAGKRSRCREMEHLYSLLEREYHSPNQIGSPCTSESARSLPADDDILKGRI